MCLYDLWVGGLTQNLKQVLVTDEVVLWEGSSVLLREGGSGGCEGAGGTMRKAEGDANSRPS